MCFRCAPHFFSASARWTSFVVAVFLMVVSTGPLSAQPTLNNADFESALGPSDGSPAPGNWARIGDVTRPGAFAGGPKNGSNQVLLTTKQTQGAVSDGNVFDHNWNYKQSGAWGWIGFADQGLMWWCGGHGSGGSAIRQKIVNVSKGDVLKVRWNFLTDESHNDSVQGDYGVMYIPDLPGRGEYRILGSQQSTFISGAGTGYTNMTGWKRTPFQFDRNGTFTLTFSVIDLYRSNKNSALLIDDIVIAIPGITIAPPTTTLVEGQPGEDVFVHLDTPPAAGVTVTITPKANAQIASYSPPSVTFNDSNWDQKKAITITAKDNAIADGNRTTTVQFDATAPSGPYNGMTENYDIDIIDDESPGVLFNFAPDGMLAAIEGTTTDSFKVRLQSRPGGGNSVTLSLTSMDNQVILSKSTLTLTDQTGLPGGWDKWQTVTVTPNDDNVPEGYHTGQIDVKIVPGGDAAYNGLPPFTPLEIGLEDNPKISGGEGTYGGTNGPPGNGGGAGGEGSFGFGTEHLGVADPTKKRTPILVGPHANAAGQFTVANVSHRQNSADPNGAWTQLGSAGIALLGVGLIVLFGKLFLKGT